MLVDQADDDARTTMTAGAPRFHRSSRDAAKERTATATAISRSSEFM
jgi:hypothetical protein